MTQKTEEFKKEWKYVVFKRSDMQKLFSTDIQKNIEKLAAILDARRGETGKAPLKCVVVENDWPEHDFVWKLIENRVTGGTPLGVYETAPLLLEALKAIVKSNAGLMEANGIDPDCCVEIKNARAAIAKATGENHV